MRILVIVGQTTLLASLFIMLGFEFSLPVKGIPSAFILLCLAVISFLIGTIGLIVGCTSSFDSGSKRAEFLVRVSPHEKGRCTVDLRSASRHKRRDMGMNVFLLNRFMSRFSKELNKERRERGLVYEDG